MPEICVTTDGVGSAWAIAELRAETEEETGRTVAPDGIVTGMVAPPAADGAPVDLPEAVEMPPADADPDPDADRARAPLAEWVLASIPLEVAERTCAIEVARPAETRVVSPVEPHATL